MIELLWQEPAYAAETLKPPREIGFSNEACDVRYEVVDATDQSPPVRIAVAFQRDAEVPGPGRSEIAASNKQNPAILMLSTLTYDPHLRMERRFGLVERDG